MSKNKENVNEEPAPQFPLSDNERQMRYNELQQLIAAATLALQECCAFADKYHLEFSWGPAYGMGGWYQGDPDERDEYHEDGWRSSSSSC